MLRAIDEPEASRLRDFLLATGYTEENLRERGVAELPSAKLRNLPKLIHITREPSCLNSLLRWFWLGQTQDLSSVESLVPSWFIDLALRCGLLCQQDASLLPRALLVHFEGFFLTSD